MAGLYPDNPTINQQVVVNGRTMIWDGSKWKVVGGGNGSGGIGGGSIVISQADSLPSPSTTPEGTEVTIRETFKTYKLVDGNWYGYGQIVVDGFADLNYTNNIVEGTEAYIRSTGETFIYVIDAGETVGQWTEKDQLGDDVDVTAATASRIEGNIYVNSTVGSDVDGDGSASSPFKTIQRAWDSLPDVIYKQHNIWLANGVYDELPAGAYAQARPAILNAYGKTTSLRSALVNGAMIGSVVIKSISGVRGDVSIRSNANEYAVYVQKGNIALQDITLDGNSSAGLLVSHRTDTYVQCLNVLVNGGSKATNQRGAYTESGGQIEFSDKCLVTNCGIGISTITDGDNITLSGDSQVTYCGTGAFAKAGSIFLAMTDTSYTRRSMIENCDTGINSVDGQVEIRGANANSLAVISDPIVGTNAFVELVFAESWDTINLTAGSTLRIDSSGYNRTVTVKGGSVLHKNSNSYLSDTTNNVDAAPLYLPNTVLELEGTNNLVGSGGTFVPFARSFNASGNNAVIPISDDTKVVFLNGNGAARTGCSLQVDSVPEGYMVYVEGSTWSVELVSGANMFLSTPITIGNSTGMYEGATFTKSRGLWRCTGLGQQRG